jgi:hypothetical protein
LLNSEKNKEEKEIKITKGELLNILEDIMNKYDKNIYSYSNIIAINDVLKSTNFSLLSMPDLMTVTYNLLQLLKTNERKSIDLTLIGGASKSGALLMSKTLKPGTKFIHTSVTGYYKKVLFEVPSGI